MKELTVVWLIWFAQSVSWHSTFVLYLMTQHLLSSIHDSPFALFHSWLNICSLPLMTHHLLSSWHDFHHFCSLHLITPHFLSPSHDSPFFSITRLSPFFALYITWLSPFALHHMTVAISLSPSRDSPFAISITWLSTFFWHHHMTFTISSRHLPSLFHEFSLCSLHHISYTICSLPHMNHHLLSPSYDIHHFDISISWHAVCFMYHMTFTICFSLSL